MKKFTNLFKLFLMSFIAFTISLTNVFAVYGKVVIENYDKKGTYTLEHDTNKNTIIKFDPGLGCRIIPSDLPYKFINENFLNKKNIPILKSILKSNKDFTICIYSLVLNKCLIITPKLSDEFFEFYSSSDSKCTEYDVKILENDSLKKLGIITIDTPKSVESKMSLLTFYSEKYDELGKLILKEKTPENEKNALAISTFLIFKDNLLKNT